MGNGIGVDDVGTKFGEKLRGSDNSEALYVLLTQTSASEAA